MDENDVIARALEAPVELLPLLPELLADLEELGSDAEQLTEVVRNLAIAPTASVVDLGCGKGAVAIEIASELGHSVLGIDLFEPFVAHAAAAARAAGVAHLCEFRHGDVRTLSDQLAPSYIAVFAALGDALGTPAEAMHIARRYVRPGGYVICSDVYLRDGGSRAFEGFERYRTRVETIRELTAWGDTLVREVRGPGSAAADDDDQEVAAIQRRVEELAVRHPEHREKLLAFADYQARAHAHIAENLIDAVWVLKRADAEPVRYSEAIPL